MVKLFKLLITALLLNSLITLSFANPIITNLNQYRNLIYAGGFGPYVAQYNISTKVWRDISPSTSPVTDSVQHSVVDPSGNYYITVANQVLKYNGKWSVLKSSGNYPTAMTFSISENLLYLGDNLGNLWQCTDTCAIITFIPDYSQINSMIEFDNKILVGTALGNFFIWNGQIWTNFAAPFNFASVTNIVANNSESLYTLNMIGQIGIHSDDSWIQIGAGSTNSGYLNIDSLGNLYYIGYNILTYKVGAEYWSIVPNSPIPYTQIPYVLTNSPTDFYGLCRSEDLGNKNYVAHFDGNKWESLPDLPQ